MINSANYLMPAEWEKHSAVWLAWPHDPVTFPGRVERVEAAYVQIIKHLRASEDVELLVTGGQMQNRAEKLLNAAEVDLKKVAFHQTDYADVWIRDYGPTFVHQPQTKELAWIKWRYNAYGNKFPDLLKDNEVFFSLRRDIDKRMLEAGLVMEGGAIETNGAGIILTTEECLLNSNRNPEFSKAETEAALRKHLGANKIIWLKKGLVNDHTDGHIDELARFVSQNAIVCASEDDSQDPNYDILRENLHALAKATNTDGRPFEIIRLPMPHIFYEDGSKAPASYANFYIGNKVVLVPAFGDPNDARALEILQNCFPTRQAVAIGCSDLIYGGGGLHCVTQQQPLL